MPRRTRYNIPPVTFTCPLCSHVNTPDGMIRLDADRIQCAGCSNGFVPVPDAKKPPTSIGFKPKE